MPPTDADVTGRGIPPGTRGLVARGFTWIEDLAYMVLGVLLAMSALALLGSAAFMFARGIGAPDLPATIVALLDRLLLVLMVIELLYTVQISFREHALVPEPFLIVGLVAATRRILVITAELTGMQEKLEVFRASMIELALLTAMIIALVASLRLLGGRQSSATAVR